jgi:hypothetical protein
MSDNAHQLLHNLCAIVPSRKPHTHQSRKPVFTRTHIALNRRNSFAFTSTTAINSKTSTINVSTKMVPTSVRRSGRNVNLPKRFRSPSPSPQSPRVEKRRSSRVLKGTRTKYVKVIVEKQRSICYISNDSEPPVRKSRFVEDFASDSDEEEEEETVSEEHVHLSADNFEYNASDPLDGRASLDSHLDSGNEEYDRDGFVVDDDSEDDVSDVTSEITINELNDIDSDADSDADSDFTVTQDPLDRQRRLSISNASATDRRDSATSTRSSDSGLFVRDPNEKPSTLARHSVTALLPAFQVLQEDVDPADVAEEISDASCRFSRRCNNHCAALRVVLTSALLQDEEVCDAVKRAVKQGLGTCIEVGDGRVLCHVGPASK